MKLSIRALLFYIGVVLFQSTLTIILVTGIITRSNETDVRAELGAETGAVYEEYNSWVRTMWKTIIRINKDDNYNKIIEDPDFMISKESFDSWFEEIQLLSEIDSILLKKKSGPDVEYLSSGNMSFSLDGFENIESDRDHPYLELREFGGSVYLTGILGVSGILDVFIFKKIDDKFYKDLGLSQRTSVYFISNSDLRSGRLLGEGLFDFLQGSGFPDVHFKEAYHLSLEDGNFNAAFQELGKLKKGDREEKLFLVLLISNEPFLSIRSSIYNTLFTVSFIVSFLAIILSFYFSRNITNPINRLMNAMAGIRGGDYKVKIDYKSGNEVGELFRGFNEMARQIDQNKKSMEQFIHEITFLKDYNEKIIYSLRAGILVVDNALSIEKVNGFFLELFQKNEIEILHKDIQDLSDDVIDELTKKKIKDVVSGEIDSWSKIKRTESFVLELKLYLLFPKVKREDRKCVVEVDDVSKKYELEEKIFQAEKLSSLSMLSAGVSHEINNPLSSILTNVQNLLADDNDDDTRTALNWIEQETRRIAKIVSELLNFSTSEQRSDEGCDVNSAVTEVVKLINYGLEKGGRIELSCHFQRNLPLVAIRRSEFQQVIINLVQNSIYAIEGKGSIIIKTGLREKDKMVDIQIVDSGAGMDEQTMLHIFDPFFTTRINGKGTGLGLSIVYGIINKNSGLIDVKSSIGEGSTFSLSIPVLLTN